MFKKMDIEKFGLFNNFKWNNELKDYPFNKVNIIYGRNYSGKTTLSRIFRSVSKEEIHEKYQDAIFTINDKSNNIITNSQLQSNYKVRVYNTDFVKENLSWLHDDENGDIKPFTLIGESNINVQKIIDELNQKLGNVEEKKGLLFDKATIVAELEQLQIRERNLEKELNNSLRHQANQVIKNNNYFVKQGVNYNISSINKEVEEIVKSVDTNLLNTEKVNNYKNIIDENEKASLEKFSSVVNLSLSQIIKDTESLIKKEITVTNAIRELVEDSLLQSWVENGIEHHKGKREKCAFCNSDISPERWLELDEHFSKESEELKRALNNKIIEIDNTKKEIDNYKQNNNIKKESFYTVLHPKYDIIIDNWDKAVINYSEITELLLEKLNKRLSDIFNPTIFNSEQKTILAANNEVIEDIKNVWKSLNDLVEENNSKTASLSREKDEARKTLRYSHIANYLNDFYYGKRVEKIRQASELTKAKEVELENIQKKITGLNEEKKAKELEKNDEGEAAKKVNNHLTNFFGHSGITLKPETVEDIESKTKFVVLREEEGAYNLSEGECSLISFCYFIAKMEDELKSSDSDKLVIYIDDPISSLDNNHIFFMFSLIETVITKNKKFGQLFISTHNLEFLKYIKRITRPCKNGINHFVIKKEKKNTESRCVIRKMPSYLKDYVTEYNFLFKEIYEAAKGDKYKDIENQFTQFYNLPNNMRKFLECYLFYKYPNTKNPLNNLDLLFDNNIPALVNRIVNEYSHLSWGQRGTLVMDVAEAQKVAFIILKAIYDIEQSHYNALCQSINVENTIDFSKNPSC